MIHSITQMLAERLAQKHWMLSTAESCTGGLIASHCTDLSGSSAWFDRGFVTYSNLSKTQMLGVPQSMIVEHGAVSEPVAKAMALGAVYRSSAVVSVAVTGIAGPSGGSPEKPVGTVWLSWCINGRVQTEQRQFAGDRSAIRTATARYALEELVNQLR